MVFKKVFSLIMVRKETEILLGFKKRGFGEGKWIGFGGKLEPNENIYECALRELKEECGLTAKDLRQIGILDFQLEGDSTLMEVHVFETFSFEGEIVETDEMRPKWFKLSDIPFNRMLPDDALWFPYMLKGIPFRGYFLCREETILSHKIEESSEFPNIH